MTIFLQLVAKEKEDVKQNWGINIVKIVDKVDKEDKLVKNWTRGRWILVDSVKGWNYIGNYGHKMGGMGYIHSDKTIPAHLVG